MSPVEKILISSCLFGQNVRYDAGNCLIEHEIFEKWQAEDRFVAICPEMAGGLPAPRAPCERDLQTNRILDKAGNDYTDAFHAGAQLALELAQKHNIRVALLKEQSPSCGSNIIYDGTFSSHKIPGQGITANLLSKNGIMCFSEHQWDDLIAHMASCD